jgi:hypothetical protein
MFFSFSFIPWSGKQPTSPHRDWLFNPFPSNNPWWTPIIAVIPATLATILIFMDQQITAVIVNRKENKLKVGIESGWRVFVKHCVPPLSR